MSERHEQRRRAHDETTCDDSRPATLAATLTCARCTPGATGLCREHKRKRAVMIRNSARRADGLRAYREHLIALASAEVDVPDVDGIDAAASVSLREVCCG